MDSSISLQSGRVVGTDRNGNVVVRPDGGGRDAILLGSAIYQFNFNQKVEFAGKLKPGVKVDFIDFSSFVEERALLSDIKDTLKTEGVSSASALVLYDSDPMLRRAYPFVIVSKHFAHMNTVLNLMTELTPFEGIHGCMPYYQGKDNRLYGSRHYATKDFRSLALKEPVRNGTLFLPVNGLSLDLYNGRHISDDVVKTCTDSARLRFN